jgi:hypothetical protein
MGTTPAGEIVVLCPDHVSCHRYTYSLWNSTEGGTPREARRAADDAKVERNMNCCLPPHPLSHGTEGRQSNYGVSSGRTMAFRAGPHILDFECLGRGFCAVKPRIFHEV